MAIYKTMKIFEKNWLLVVFAGTVIGLLIGMVAFSETGPGTAKSMADDICRELSGISTSKFVEWNGFGSNSIGLYWAIECTTGFEFLYK